MSNGSGKRWWKDFRWQIGTGQALVVAISIAVAVGGIMLYASTTTNPQKSIAFGGMIAGASLVAGSVIGFLFTLPRSVSVATGEGRAEGLSNITVRPNTNLEEVSDWITKIIVGLTLTQLGKIPSAAGHLFYILGQSLGKPPESTIFAGCLVVYSSIVGLVNGWLMDEGDRYSFEGRNSSGNAATVFRPAATPASRAQCRYHSGSRKWFVTHLTLVSALRRQRCKGVLSQLIRARTSPGLILGQSKALW